MIILSSNAKPSTRTTWRRRISNQLAAFAAIMLFASTQVGSPENTLNLASEKTQAAAQGVLSDVSAPSLELQASLDQATRDRSKKSTRSSEKSGFNLNLFRFRR